jgi:hypothetical protein
MPAHDGVGRDDDEHCFPVTPKAAKDNPEQPIYHSELRTGVLTLEHHELLSQGKVFNHQAPARVKQPQKQTYPDL